METRELMKCRRQGVGYQRNFGQGSPRKITLNGDQADCNCNVCQYLSRRSHGSSNDINVRFSNIDSPQ